MDDYGCLMLNLDYPLKQWIDFISRIINKNDIYDEDDYGICTHPHCTILHGLHDNESDVSKIHQLSKPYLLPINEIKAYTNKIDAFKNEEYDVLKFNVISKQLSNMNNLLKKNFEYTTDFPKYDAHCTICYLKPGTSDKYVRQLSKPYLLKPKSYEYSAPNDNRIIFTI